MNPTRKLILAIALALDMALGDPPNRFHPVAWMGRLITLLKQRRPYGDPNQEYYFGAKILFLGGGVVVIVGWLLKIMIDMLPRPMNWLLEAGLLKSMFALRGLHLAAGEVQAALEVDDLPDAKRLVSWHLVSRETNHLDESGVVAATIESVSENASDSLVAPLFYYLLGGLPMAFLYRFFNTADAMLGYRTLEFEWLGKIAAKIDDLLNLIPARMTASLLVLAASLLGMPVKRVVETIQQDAGETASPNAGFPMSAMAGALGVKLEKAEHYSLGSSFPKPRVADISRARTLLFALTGIGLALVLLLPNTYRKRNNELS